MGEKPKGKMARSGLANMNGNRVSLISALSRFKGEKFKTEQSVPMSLAELNISKRIDFRTPVTMVRTHPPSMDLVSIRLRLLRLLTQQCSLD